MNQNHHKQIYLICQKKKFYENPKFWIKLFLGICFIGVIIVAVIYREKVGELFLGFLDWFGQNLVIGCGFVFAGSIGIVGVFVATLVVWLGASFGASTAFLFGRFICREGVSSFKQKSEKFDLIDRVVSLNGFKVTLLLRLSPIVPFNVFNYFMGLTGVTFRAYNIAHVGMLPGTLAYCFIGGTLGSIAEAGAGVGFSNPVVLIVTIVGTVITVIGMVAIGIYGKKQFAKLAEQVKKEKEQEKKNEEEQQKLDNKNNETIDVNDKEKEKETETNDIEMNVVNNNPNDNDDDNDNNDDNNGDNNEKQVV